LRLCRICPLSQNVARTAHRFVNFPQISCKKSLFVLK
jgi:hypothetical protein